MLHCIQTMVTILKKKFGSYTNSGSLGPPPPTTPMVPKRVMWFLNNTPMHQFGALSDHLITYRLARFLHSLAPKRSE